jgi:2-isopropylmalate synthase
MGVGLLSPEHLARLTETAHLVDELLNRVPDPAQPYVGKHAFAHKAGLHAAGIRADSQSFEHIDPAVVGNSRDVLISEIAGRGTIEEKAGQAGIAAGGDFSQRVLERVKELEHRGFQFEAADGSFELLMRKEAGEYEPLFRLESWRVMVEKRADGKVATEATIKIWLGGERFVRTAEGNGPVHALDRALRDAIGAIHPHLKDIDLVNFKVRILDERKGTGAVTRVLIDASDGHDVWGSIGVSENLIAASWDALVDSLEYGMQPGRRPGEHSRQGASAASTRGEA